MQLPGELRTEVYKHLLLSPKGAFPDTTSSRKYRSCNHHLGTLEEPYPLGVAILQTCRQIHEEAAPVLYGMNNFAFTTHAVCRPCILRQNCTNHYDPDPSCIIQTDCGLQLMYTWLCLIGSTNRALIESIHVFIFDAAYLYYDGEPRLVGDKWTLGKPAGQFLVKALDLLSRKHSLQSLMIHLPDLRGGDLHSHFLYNGIKFKLFSQLANLNGPNLTLKLWPAPEDGSHLKLLKRLGWKIRRRPRTQAKTAVAEPKDYRLVILPPKRPRIRETKSVPVLADNN
jgi:hypothetical protein